MVFKSMTALEKITIKGGTLAELIPKLKEIKEDLAVVDNLRQQSSSLSSSSLVEIDCTINPHLVPMIETIYWPMRLNGAIIALQLESIKSFTFTLDLPNIDDNSPNVQQFSSLLCTHKTLVKLVCLSSFKSDRLVNIDVPKNLTFAFAMLLDTNNNNNQTLQHLQLSKFLMTPTFFKSIAHCNLHSLTIDKETNITISDENINLLCHSLSMNRTLRQWLKYHGDDPGHL
ncbi:hypothetical protein DFA_01894 [Cavenderia fasciculata]|uniref:Uncharacterized protein n=1 Tax=Cavenderia fasciculata TaxID=261658 RepID=F4PV97_CACFS|nr:uncharacterized protein DFA_01894 [Cavenderia fasciculata]EGG22005.1 hypothetical protein DFA_01894 [Cavenderia fasciculata]|eukprot:XP_004359856.1 hypothetical protein DFA_01894 [Cavenderia fasciculata]